VVTQSAPVAPARPSASAVLLEREKHDLAVLRRTTRAGPSALLARAQVRALAVGNGWGCVALEAGMSESVMQCWSLDAAAEARRDAKTLKSIEARLVPWLPAGAFAAGDRLCAREEGPERCWPALEFLTAQPAGLPVVWSRPAWKSRMDSPTVGDISADFFWCGFGFGGPVQCWGESRDGFFGRGDACAEKRKREWPAEHGPVAAPKAACAGAPTPVPGLARLGGIASWSAGPRGVCATDFHRVSRCAGAIPQPPPRTKEIAVGTGDEPNACGVLEEGVVCWGGRYSPASAPSRFVRIALAQPAPSGAPVVDSAGRADRGCQVHRPCLRPFRALSACGPGEPARPWSELVRDAEPWRGKSVRVSGQLFVGSGSASMAGCGRLDSGKNDADEAPICCNSSFFPLVVVSDGRTLRVDGHDCHGDESRACCNLAASGEDVIATGTLEQEDRGPTGWVLRGPALCAR
jgi:hypothetical protein